MKKNIVLFVLLITSFVFAQKPFFTTAKTKAATVYFSGAELMQTTSLNLPTGTHEVVIKNVADQLNENTIQIGAPSTLTILSIQFTQNYISEYEIDENNPNIRKVRDSIDLLQKSKLRYTNERTSHSKTIELLDKNQQISGQNSSINVAELMKLVEYYNTKRTQLNNAMNELSDKEASIQKKIDLLNKKLEINTEKEEKASKGKLVLQVMNEVAGTVNLDISYITNNASWQPFYDLRAENTSSPINLLYKGKVMQNTGVDWKKVKLALSNGNPNQSNTAPLLSAWFLRYGYPNQMYYQNAPMSNTIQSLSGSVSGLQINENKDFESRIVLRGNRSITGENNALVVIDGQISNQSVLTQLPPEVIKSVNVLKGAQGAALYGAQGVNGVIQVSTKDMNDYTSIEENQLNITFDIDIPYDILSNGKMHSVALKDLKLPATYKYYAVPKMEKEAFLLAELNDYGKYNLLPGEANIIFEGMNVGKTYINPNQTQDTLNLSMGRDKKIAIKREKVIDKSGTKFLSSYKEQTFTYDITVRNNKKEEIQMLLKDQFPLSTDKDITIEYLDKDGAKHNEETGVLTWEIKLKPNETKKYRISYRVKHPKDKTIGNL